MDFEGLRILSSTLDQALVEEILRVTGAYRPPAKAHVAFNEKVHFEGYVFGDGLLADHAHRQYLQEDLEQWLEKLRPNVIVAPGTDIQREFLSGLYLASEMGSLKPVYLEDGK